MPHALYQTVSERDDEATDVFSGQSLPEPPPLALVVNGEPQISDVEQAGFLVATANKRSGALAFIKKHRPQVVVIGDSSLTTCAAIRKANEAIPIIVTTPDASSEYQEKAHEAGATDLLAQGVSAAVVKQRLSFVVGAHRAFDDARQNARRLTRAQRLARFATWSWDITADRVQWSDELCRLLKRPQPDSRLGLDAILEMVHPGDHTVVERHLIDAIRGGRTFSFDHRVTSADGRERILHQEGEVLIDGSSQASALEGVVIDVTEQRQAQDQLHNLANYDRLTGLPNRLSFLDLLRHALERDDRAAMGVGVAMLDLDHFKQVNESLGHDLGDQLLKAIADRLLHCLRKGDFVAREREDHSRTVARQGGDEFLIMLSDMHEAHYVARVARRIIEAFARPFPVGGQEIYITPSIGIAMSSCNAVEGEKMIRQAEIAMYNAKRRGRNNFQFFDGSMQSAVQRRFEMERSLRKALSRDELVLYYQPLVNAQTRAFVGVEALLRWDHPKRGLLAADEFVPLAEETGLIVPMGRWVLRTACEQLGRWRKQGVGPIRMSVNLSPREIRAAGFLVSLAQTLEETDTPPEWLELELTERGVMQNDRETLDTLRRIKEMGVRLAVDDFGTGHTTFHYLKHFPLDTLKIDKSFTRGIASDQKDAAITLALLAMAHRLRLNVVAEGVENEAQMSFLGDNHCDQVQGFLFGKPIPARRLTAMLRDRHSSVQALAQPNR